MNIVERNDEMCRSWSYYADAQANLDLLYSHMVQGPIRALRVNYITF